MINCSTLAAVLRLKKKRRCPIFFIGKSGGPHVDLSICNHRSIFGISLDSFENMDMYGHINAYTCVSDAKV
ncbi:hypothetical protein NC652_026487 [Populus alba x Populus x berolinensis]|uniref:Uncharacterized protein n=1 Tax=Populus alba x Populus x berolinensis TaxID=444605 RepID=A0AAD6Q8H4_9ROSI|nr:hypothetical protein NC652_026487 [Populus alba x Populus x berolinensis]KAJ6983154.1 hypothetical protein NC653_026080 [Populus alba x Populus x berolinensis]